MKALPSAEGGARGWGAVQLPGELPLTYEDFRKIAAMIHADAGIYLSESKIALVHSRLAKRLRALGLESFRDYSALVATKEGVDERQKMLAALTTNVTKFFREPHHFDHLERKVLPPLLEAARRGARVRLWSAACSNGQEPYSIALSLLKLMPGVANLDVKILATDIDPNMIAEGMRGIYTDSVLAAVPAQLRARWFVPVHGMQGEPGRSFRADDALRELVAFRELNLMGRWPMKGPFQAILCRNVAIYFEEATQKTLWSRFVPLLAPGGILYLGHSERVTGAAAAQFDSDGITTYRLRPEAIR
jgi:chemotaxis protein methyltransferase CheR